MASPAKSRTGNETWVIEPMQLDDIGAVKRIERLSFSTPWPRDSYKHEVLENRMAHYLVLRRVGPPLNQAASSSPAERPSILRRILRLGDSDDEPGDVVGFAGIWKMVDEAHITTVAVDPKWRRRGLGELMVVALIEKSINLGADLITLEVRASNGIAQRLYKKYGFYANGIRPRYYSDNGEDALVMWSPEVGGSAFRDGFAENKRTLMDRLSWKQSY